MKSLPLLPQYRDVVVKPRAHDYLVDGEKYQRVTTALSIINKPALIPWAKRVALAKVSDVLLDPAVRAELVLTIEESPGNYEEFVSKVIDRASKAPDEARNDRADTGTEIHSIVQHASGFPPNEVRAGINLIEPEYHKPVLAALDFLADFKIQVCDTERVVWLTSVKIAGTIDGVGWRGDDLVIWDWKTGAHIYWETALQLGAYARLLESLTGVSVKEAFAVRLPSADDKGGYEVKSLSKYTLDKVWDSYYQAFQLHQASRRVWWEEA